jgi:hypothetical protein
VTVVGSLAPAPALDGIGYALEAVRKRDAVKGQVLPNSDLA